MSTIPAMVLTPEQNVLQQAARQRMLVARHQVAAAGMTARQIRYRLERGRWKQVRPDVFAVDGRAPATWEAAVLAAVLAVPGAVASHRTALWLHGIARLGKPDVIELSVPLGGTTSMEGVRLRQRRHLPDEDRGERHGIPVTSGERTVIDLAPELELGARLGILEDALTSGAASRKRFVRRGRACSMGRAGVRLLVEAAGDDGAARFRSWLEAEAARVWQAAGLPAPEWNVVLRDRRGRIGEIDAVFPGGIVTVELDGMRFHSTATQRRRDKARDRRLALSGRIPLRYDWHDVVHRPHVMVAEIREALAARPQGASGA